MAHHTMNAQRPQRQQALKRLVKAREPLKARALCLTLLREAEALLQPYSVHSYLTLMKNLGACHD